MQEQSPKSETIMFNGIPFRRYPNSRHSNHRNYYSPSAKYIKQGVGNLHVEIWKAAHGAVPPGCQIHHKDGNPLNNSIDNLECLTIDAHKELHRVDGRIRAAIAFKDSGKRARFFAGAANWHKSEEGRAWQREQSKRNWKSRTPLQFTCEQCGAVFESLKRGTVRFCSNKCKAKWRRDTGADHIEKQCEQCGKLFSNNKYDTTRFCSRLCARHSRHWRNP